MNCGIILLFLLFFNQRGCAGSDESGCGCEKPAPSPCRPEENECGCGRERERECGRERDTDRDGCTCNNDSRFEPRFESRPFSDAGCGCKDK